MHVAVFNAKPYDVDSLRVLHRRGAGITATTLDDVTGFERGGPLHVVQPPRG